MLHLPPALSIHLAQTISYYNTGPFQPAVTTRHLGGLLQISGLLLLLKSIKGTLFSNNCNDWFEMHDLKYSIFQLNDNIISDIIYILLNNWINQEKVATSNIL